MGEHLKSLLAALAVVLLVSNTGVRAEGVCPHLPYPSQCRENSDFCQTDSDCRVATFKCCSNGCNKVCAASVPSKTATPTTTAPVQRTRPGNCPALPVRKYCFTKTQECSNDFDCKELYKCCSNGCVKRCHVATIKKAIENGFSKKNATCPHFPKNITNCPQRSSNQCDADSECRDQGSSFKCCWDGCRKICIDPSEIQQTEALPSKFRLDDKCPFVPRPLRCPAGALHHCYNNEECPKPLMCCSDGCRNICHDITKDTSILCPIVRRPETCTAIVRKYTCKSVADCGPGHKCCFDGCHRRCFGRNGFTNPTEGPPPTTASPTTTPPPPTTTTSAPTTTSKPQTTKSAKTTAPAPTTTEPPATTTTTEAPATTVAKTTHQQKTTKIPTTEYVAAGNRPTTVARVSKPGRCRYIPRDEVCIIRQCFDDLECDGVKKCCSGCCVKPQSNVENAPAKGRPKPGICPTISRLGITCPSSDQCGVDQDCAGTMKCCSHYCRRMVCVEPPSKEEENRLKRLYRPGRCPSIKTNDLCQNKDQNKCNYDVDCRSPSQKCCSDGCNRQCYDPVGLPVPTVPTSSPVKPEIIQGRCPPYSPVKSCPKLVQDGCTCSSDCAKGFKCCFDGCKRICRKPAGEICAAQIDIVYLMDTSGSISLSDYDLEKQFVKDLARIFRIDVDASHAAVIIYNDDPHMQIKLGDHKSPEDFAKAVDGIPYLHGRTRIDKALKASEETFKNARSTVRKVLVLLTDGRQTQDPDALNLTVASQPLKEMGVKIYAVGVGHKIDQNELKQITPDVFTASSFTDLLGKSQTIAAKACGDVIGKVCVRGVDLGFIVDSSESITDDDFIKEKYAIKAISDEFIIAPQSTRVGVVLYSEKPQTSISFGQHSSNPEFNRAVNYLVHMQSNTRLDLALRHAATNLYNRRRQANPAIAIVMTDGRSTPGSESLATAVRPLRDLGVRVFAVGVGPRVSQADLRQLVERLEDIYTVDSFSELIKEAKKVTQRACPAPSETILPPSTRPTQTPITKATQPPATRATQPPVTRPTQSPVTTDPFPSPPSNVCSYFLDIIFVLDSSSSIAASEYDKQKAFVIRMSKIFNVGKGSRAAVIIYSDDPILSITFDQYNKQEDFIQEIQKLPFIMQRTRIDKALKMASAVLLDSRPGFPKAVIIMTDGRQTRDPDYVPLNLAAAPLHNAGARVLVVGIGPQISVPELMLMVKNDTRDVYTVQSFDGLVNAAIDVAIKSCQGPIPTKLPESCPEAFDLAFVMDSSGSMLRSSYEKEKNFVKNVVGRFTVGLRKIELALVSFSDFANTLVTFGTPASVSLQQFNAAVDGAQYVKGRTRIDRALKAVSSLFKFGRFNVPKVLVFLTDGRQSSDPGYTPIKDAVKPLIDQDVKIIVVGIGEDLDRDQLLDLANGQTRDVTQISSFDDLDRLKNSFAQTICRKVEEITQRGSP